MVTATRHPGCKLLSTTWEVNGNQVFAILLWLLRAIVQNIFMYKMKKFIAERPYNTWIIFNHIMFEPGYYELMKRDGLGRMR